MQYRSNRLTGGPLTDVGEMEVQTFLGALNIVILGTVAQR